MMNLLKRHYNYTYWLKKAKATESLPRAGKIKHGRKQRHGIARSIEGGDPMR